MPCRMSIADWIRKLLNFLSPPSEIPETTPVDEIEAALSRARASYLDIRARSDPLLKAREDVLKRIAGFRERHSQLTEDARQCITHDDSAAAEDLMVEQQVIEGRIIEAEGDLGEIEPALRKVLTTLEDLEGQIQTLERDRDRAASRLAGAQARIDLNARLVEERDLARDRQSVTSRAREALESTVERAKALESIEEESVEARLEALSSDDSRAQARLRLEALKQPRITGPSSGKSSPGSDQESCQGTPGAVTEAEDGMSASDEGSEQDTRS